MKTIFKVLIPIVAIVRIYYCEDQAVPPPNLSAEKKIFDSEERKEPKEVDLKNSPLSKLDEELVKELKNPTPADVHNCFEVKLDVLKNLVQYEEHIKNLYVGVYNNTVTGLQLARDLVDQGGPQFLREDIDVEKIKTLYNWDDDNVDHLNDLLRDIKSVYNNIIVNVREKPSLFDIYFNRRRNDFG